MQAGMVLGILTAVIALIVLSAVRRMRALKAAQKQLLEQNGFSPCDAEARHLEEIVRSLRGSSRLRVRRPWKRASMRGGDVYWYELSAGNQDESASEEFLFSLRRSSSEPFLLYLRPPMLRKGLGSRLMEKLLTVTAPRRLHKLDLSDDTKSDALLAAFGPRDSSLHELVDADKLAVLAQGACHGVFAVRGAGDHCALELHRTHARKAVEHGGWLDTWSFVQRVTV